MTESPPIPGNLYDKYGTRNPVARLLMAGFLGTMARLVERVNPRDSVLEVGCGEGHLAHELSLRQGPFARFELCDLSLDRLRSDLGPSIRPRVASIYELPYADREFDLVICSEVLEHLEAPERGLRELTRVARHAVLVSTPHEPWFRILNLCRGAYLEALGNTPGHLQHFGPSTLRRLLEPHLTIDSLQRPLPWLVALCRPLQRSPGANRSRALVVDPKSG